MKTKKWQLVLGLVVCLGLLWALGAGLAYGQTVCEPQVFNLTAGAGQGAGSGTVMGTVTVWNDTTNLYVKYKTNAGWFLDETHVAICNTEFTQRPAPGLSPYKQDHAAGTTTYTYTIPLLGMLFHPDCPYCPQPEHGPPTPCSFDAVCDTTLYIAAHADVSGISSQTAYGGGCIKPDGAWFCQIAYPICCGEIPPPPPECEDTAWGKAASGDECFINISQLGSNNWGWTNLIPVSGTYPQTYELTLWAGAAQCNTAKGTAVGTVTVTYDGTTAHVTYSSSAPFTFSETHVWIGKTMLPYKNPKNPAAGFTAAPGRFPYKDGASVNISAPFWVAAHAKVKGPCDAFGTGSIVSLGGQVIAPAVGVTGR